MGTWDVGVEDNDFVTDLLDDFIDLIKKHGDIAAASAEYREDAAEYDDDELPEVWLALALAQWTYGRVDEDVLEQVRGDLATGRSLENWEDEGPEAVEERRKTLERFIAKIAVPRKRPKRLPRVKRRPPVFEVGACLALRLEDGRYGAGFVVAADHSDPEYGRNLIACLNYTDASPPTLETFENWRLRRRARELGWFDADGYARVRDHIDVIGTTQIRPTDPTFSSLHAPWTLLLDPAKPSIDMPKPRLP